MESSGTNPLIKKLVKQHDHITILVWTPLEIIKKRIEGKKNLNFNPKRLNEYILDHFINGMIQFDTKYFTQSDKFYPYLKIEEFE